MFRRVDTVAGLAALALHVIVALILISVPPPKARSSTEVEVEVRHAPPPEPITPPKPPEPEPEKKVVPKVKPVVTAAAPTPPKDVPPPPKAAPPVYEVKEVVEGESSVAIQQGDNGSKLANPNVRGPSVPQPGGGQPGAPQQAYKGTPDVYIKTLPEIDGEACAKMVTYPAEAEAQGIEGDILLKVSLEDTGKVHAVRVLKGLGYGLDEAAVNALKHKCRFKPAVGTDGKPVPYEIQQYKWTFELPR